MSSRAKAKDEARRARVAEMRRAELARKRRIQIISVVGIAVLVAAVIIGGFALVSSSGDESGGEDQADLIRGEETWDDLSQDHVDGEVDYPMSPPVGGEHNLVWADCDATVYEEEIPEEQAVHSLEHGAVWITYNDKAKDSDIETLSERVSNTPYSMMSPYQDQESPITLSAWGHQLGVDKASDPRVEEFLNTYVQGEQTPEVGASCTASQ
jgi:hypothetical protein